jgi:hypothetical protein
MVRHADFRGPLVVRHRWSPEQRRLDYEGVTVPYSTDFEFDADLIDSSGAVLASDSHVVTSSPLR